MKDLLLLDIDLALFDGEGGAPSGDGGQTAESGVATQTSNQEVLYGKVEEPKEVKPQENVDPSAKFEEMIKGEYKEQFDKRIQSIIDKRFKQVKELEKKTQSYDSIMDILQKKYGTDKSDEIMQRIETEVVEELAYQNDMTPENYRKIMNAEKIERQRQMEEQDKLKQMQINQTLEKWSKQAEEAKAEYPDFDYLEWMKNDKFVDLLKSNVDVKTAYMLLNIDNLTKKMVKEVEQKTAQSVAKKQSRPNEAALKNQSGPIIKSDVKSLTKADREEIAKRAQRGEKISFG
jgi:hypothetical protein